MIREVELNSYLPPYLTSYRELTAAHSAEEPEFNLVWNATDQTLKNEFIETADEYGISRFEKLLKLFPDPGTPLEARRAAIQLSWFNTIPYTLRAVIEKLKEVFGEENFEIIKDYMHYRLEIKSLVDSVDLLSALIPVINRMVPANMVMIYKNEIRWESGQMLVIGGGTATMEYVTITDHDDITQ
jgi:hypothetical protein